MGKAGFKNFSDLDFIQGIDKPCHLAKFLKPYAFFFRAKGVDVGQLQNNNPCNQQLLELLTTAEEDMPSGLLADLYIVDDLADEDGRDLMLDEAEKQGLDLRGIVGQGMSAGEFALAVHSAYPEITTMCHDMMRCRKAKNYEEYLGLGLRALTLELAKHETSAMESEMAPWFEGKDRSRACEIYAYQEGREIRFMVTHGRPCRVEPIFDSMLKRSSKRLRPQKHDSVIYDTSTGVLKVNAQTTGERDLYRRTIGKVLFGDPDCFPDGQVYTLGPLCKGRPSLSLVADIESVRLTETYIDVDDDHGFCQHSRAYDLIQMAERRGQPNFQQGNIVRAVFMVKYKTGGRARKLEVRPPRVAVYDRDRDGDATEAFLTVNGFLKVSQ